VGLATGFGIWFAIARVGAWINLFNLLPLGSLDGGRAFHALTRRQRWLAVLAIAVVWSLSSNPATEGLLLLLLLAGIIAAAAGRPSAEPDHGALMAYISLVAVLTPLAGITGPLPAAKG
jgi:membrane-associated protease RseP (regulator of RpoE activity)